MVSPFTGGEAHLLQEQREMIYRKEKYAYVARFYVCVDTQEQFTTTELDELNLGQVHNQYRVQHGIPFPDEMKTVRKSYGLSAPKMSEILGLGTNQYRLYENGEMPSEAIGKTLKSIMNPSVFAEYVRNAENQFSKNEYIRICDKLEKASDMKDNIDCRRYIYNMPKCSAVNGYAPHTFEKTKNVILYFINRLGGVFSTKMNKLLFYADFCCYKRYCIGMTGLSYKAIQYGPVPERWNILYGSIDEIDTEIVSFPSGNSGERLVSHTAPDLSYFSEKELSILNEVIDKLGQKTANQLSVMSHAEDAWIRFKDDTLPIDYTEAFTLKAL